MRPLHGRDVTMPDQGRSIILFDGVCNLCNRLVQFVIKRDPRAHFCFAALQSDFGRDAVRRHGLNPDDMDSMVLIEGERCLTRSDAALAIVRGLRFPWPLLGAGVIIPRPIRESIYRWIARNRYRWFGKRESCMRPTPELLARFVS